MAAVPYFLLLQESLAWFLYYIKCKFNHLFFIIMALLQSIEDKQFAANVKMLRQTIEEQIELQKETNALLKELISLHSNKNS